MLFVTFDFLIFLIPVLVITWTLGHRPVARGLFLLVCSYFFYMAGPKTDPLPTPWYYVGLLFLSTVLDYVCSHRIYQSSPPLTSPDQIASRSAQRSRKFWFMLSLVGNLGLLAYFKYTGFLLEAFSDIAHSLGLSVIVPQLKLVLPVGISFYTFQSLSYTIDVWRGRLTPEPSFLKFALFVVFFPQLVAGPIVRANEFLPQLHRRPKLSADRMYEGMFRIAKGIVKKTVLGDWIAVQLTDAIFANPTSYTSAECLLALYGFTLQLYADFSGYSDIAIGVSRLLGYDIPENFDRPYQARNIGEFWRKWHMTLSTWLRDYLFFPLGGSRGTRARTYFNLWLTMFLVGMWHGASWNFVIYSNLHAAAMLFNRWNQIRVRSWKNFHNVLGWFIGLVVAPLVVLLLSVQIFHLEWTSSLILTGIFALTFAVVARLKLTGTWWNAAVHIFLTFHFTVLSRLFFRANDLDSSRQMLATILDWDFRGIREGMLSPGVVLALVAGFAYHFTPKEWIDRYAYRLFRRLPGPIIGLIFAALALMVMTLMSGAPKAFIYFQF